MRIAVVAMDTRGRIAVETFERIVSQVGSA